MASPCLTPALVEALANGTLAPDAARIAREHLEECARCRGQRDAARADVALFAELRAVVRSRRDEGTPSSEDMPQIEGYRLERELHRGGQGVVWLATRLETQRTVALKLLLGGPLAAPRDRLRFEREIELAAGLRHPSIVAILDSGVSHGSPWCAMQYVEGRPLHEYVAARPLALRTRLALFLAVVRAVAFAHQHGVIHRDLKPSNVLIDGDGRPHVLDFGLAKTTLAPSEHERALTRTGEFLGTLAYASPEQTRGDPSAIDTRSDVYSLGVMLYELISGATPYDVDGEPSTVLRNIAEAEPRPLAAHGIRVERPLETLLSKTLAKDPERRYASAGALAQDLARFLAGEPIEARGDDLTYRLSRAFVRHRRAIVASVALGAIAVVALAFVLAAQWRADRQRETALEIRSVLQDLLTAAAPERMGGGIPLVEVFEETARRIENTLAGAPDVQAAVQSTLGEICVRLFRFEEAESHLRAALDRYRAVGEPLEVARCLDLLGEVWRHDSRPAAVDLANEALAIRTRELPQYDPAIAASRRNLASALACRYPSPDLTRAEELCRAAAAELEGAVVAQENAQLRETIDFELARTLHILAEILAKRGSDEGAEQAYTRALALFDRLGSAADARALQCSSDFSGWLTAHGRFDEAAARASRSVECARRLFGDERVPDALRGLARIAFARADYAASEELSRRAVSQELVNVSRRHPSQALELDLLAERLREPRTDPPSPPPYLEAFRHLIAIRGVGAYELASWMNGLAGLERHQGRTREAEALLTEALRIHCRVFGDDCPLRLRGHELLADVQLERGDPRSALEHARIARATRERLGLFDDDGGAAATELYERCLAACAACGSERAGADPPAAAGDGLR